MIPSITKLAVAFALVGTVTAQLNYQINYVDADTNTNTTLADGTTYVPLASTSGTDNEWALRPFGNGATVLTTHDVTGSTEDAPMLRTRISGLLPGLTYNIYSYWWSDTNSWRGRSVSSATIPAALIQGYNTVHFATSVFLPMQPLALGAPVGFEQVSLDLNYDVLGMETDGHFANPVMIAEGNRTMYETVLGQFVADANGEIDVYIDDLEGTQGTGNRTWYDGVGYELAPLPYGNACGIGEIAMTGVPHRTTDWVIDLNNGDVNALAIALVGVAPLPPFDLGTIGFTPGCFLNVDFLLLAATFTDATGKAGYAGNLATLPALTPVPLYFQWATFDPALALSSMTQGLEVYFHY